MNNKVFIIAEADVNHNGKPELALKLIDVAADAGADAVKFQTFKSESLVTKNAAKAEYQQKITNAEESQFEMLKKLELTHETYIELVARCKKRGIKFLSTAFEMESLSFLNNVIGLNTLKIPSGEITNGPLLLAHAQTGCELIVSTGMTTLSEIEDGLGVIAFGLMHGDDSSIEPTRDSFAEAISSPVGQNMLKEKVTLLHCTSDYPAPSADINLNAMLSIGNTFGLKIGYSDHSEGIAVSIAAATLGATILEKHFTIDKGLPGPDHVASLDPTELKELVIAVRTIELAMGNGRKEPSPSEMRNKNVSRKSLFAACDIAEGEVFTKENLAIKRPGNGISPMEYWDILGKKSQKNYREEEIIS